MVKLTTKNVLKKFIGYEDGEKKENFKLFFVIPEFQRRYTWDNEKREQFFLDLLNAFEKRKDENFSGLSSLGVFYVFESGDKFEILDGQQRLTSVFILLESLRCCLTKDEWKHSLLDFSNNRILNGFSKTSEVEKNYNHFFNNFLYEKESFNEEEAKKIPGFEDLYNGFNHFVGLINDFNSEENSNKKLIEFYNFLLEDVGFFLYIEDNEEIKTDLFTKLNDRGSKLNFANLFKSYFYTIDNLHIEDWGDGNKVKSHVIANWYEKEVEVSFLSELPKKISKIVQKEKMLTNACSDFLWLNGVRYGKSKNKNDAIHNERKLFVQYKSLLDSLFKGYNNDNVIQIMTFLKDLQKYLTEYSRLYINDTNQYIFKLRKIEVLKYAPIIVWLEIYSKEKNESLNSSQLIEIEELIYAYSFSRRIKWFIDNEYEIKNSKNTTQLDPRKLRAADFKNKYCDYNFSFVDARKELIGYFNDDLMNCVSKFINIIENDNDKDTKWIKSKKVFNFLNDNLELYKEILLKNNIKIN